MTASTLNGAAWRLYRHINRYSQMSVLYGSNLSSVTAGPDVQAVAADDSVYRNEADYFGQPAPLNPAQSQQPQTNVAQPLASRTATPLPHIRPVASPMGPANQTALARPVQPANHQVGAAPMIARVETQVAQAQSLPTISPQIQRSQVVPQPNWSGAQPAAIDPVQRFSNPNSGSFEQTPASVPNLAQPVNAAAYSQNPVSSARPVQRMGPAQQAQPGVNPAVSLAQPVSRPSAAPVAQRNTVPAPHPTQPMIQPAPPPVIQRDAAPVISPAGVVPPTANPLPNSMPAPAQTATPHQPVQRNQDAVAPQGSAIPDASPAPPTAQPATVVPAAPEPAPAPKIDRAQQERMGQMAAHNPDMVRVPKHMSDTQVWNGLSRINDFHLSRDQDDDPRTPWERKVVEKKPERPKKILRRTAIEEVGRPKKNKKVNPVQRTSAEPVQSLDSSTANEVQSMQADSAVNRESQAETTLNSSAPESVSREIESSPATDSPTDTVSRDYESSIDDSAEIGLSRTEMAPAGFDSPATTNNFDSTPSLEDVWPVQRLDDPSSMLSNNGSDPDLVNLDPPSRPIVSREEQVPSADIQSVISRVESAQQSDSSIDFVPPTRPRPQILRKPKPSVASESKPSVEPNFEPNLGSSESVQTEAYGVQTEFGELPSDLWNLVGDQPPATQSKQQSQHVSYTCHRHNAHNALSNQHPDPNRHAALTRPRQR